MTRPHQIKPREKSGKILIKKSLVLNLPKINFSKSLFEKQNKNTRDNEKLIFYDLRRANLKVNDFNLFSKKMSRTWREITSKTDFEEVLSLSNSRPQAVLITCKFLRK